MQPALTRRRLLGLSSLSTVSLSTLSLTPQLAAASPRPKGAGKAEGKPAGEAELDGSGKSDAGTSTGARLRGNRITWLGFSTVMIETPDGRVLLIDPWLTFPASPLHPDRVERLDGILITHGHWQHVGEAVPLHHRTGAPILAVEEVSAWLRQQGVKKAPKANLGATVELAGIRVSITPAQHTSGLYDPGSGQVAYGGNAAGFVVHLPGNVHVYHAGDTDVFQDMALIRERWAPNIGLLPIGDVTTMGPDGAAIATRLLGLEVVIPMHYDLPEFTGTPDAFAKALAARKVSVEMLPLRRGQSFV